MSKVLSFLSAHPEILKQLPGLSLYPDSRTDDVKAVATTILEVEQENMAYEECHIALRLTLSADWEFESPIWSLDVVRVSIEHGDHDPIAIAIGGLNEMMRGVASACTQLQCYQGSEKRALPLLEIVEGLLRAVPVTALAKLSA